MYDPIAQEMQVRVALPDGGSFSGHLPGYGDFKVSCRTAAIIMAHNSGVGGHLGREAIVDRLTKEYWWSGLYGNVSKWLKT